MILAYAPWYGDSDLPYGLESSLGVWIVSFRDADEGFAILFSSVFAFSEHLVKWEDDQLRDKYDHNCFRYSGQPSSQEIRKASDYQRRRGDSFLKMVGYEPLDDTYGLEGETTLTMALPDDVDVRGWTVNPKVSIKSPDPSQLERLELKCFGAVCGNDFIVRNNRRLREKVPYLGAYLDGRLVGSCYMYAADGLACVDSLMVDEDFRHRHVATTLLKRAIEDARKSGAVPYLHADAEDTPKDMYARLGFRVVDETYEYVCTDLTGLTLD